MPSAAAAILVLMTVLLTGVRGGDKSSGEKIVIHVPYKIHRHLHTHTNYKLIKVPEETFGNHEVSGLKNEEEHHKKELKIDSAVPSMKSTIHINSEEMQFKPSHTLQSFKPNLFSNPSKPYPGFADVERVQNVPAIKQKPITEQLISTSNKVPTLMQKFQATEPNYQLHEDHSYQHKYSTESSVVPFYNSQISYPSYEVEEKEADEDSLSLKIIPIQSELKPRATAESSASSFVKNYIQKNPYIIRTGKTGPTIKTFAIPSTAPYTVQGATHFPVQITKSIVPTLKTPKSLYAHGGDFEQIGYLVVGENSHKFIGLNNDKE